MGGPCVACPAGRAKLLEGAASCLDCVPGLLFSCKDSILVRPICSRQCKHCVRCLRSPAVLSQLWRDLAFGLPNRLLCNLRVLVYLWFLSALPTVWLILVTLVALVAKIRVYRLAAGLVSQGRHCTALLDYDPHPSYWCPAGSTNGSAYACPPGYYCSGGSAWPNPCPAGNE